MVPGPHRGVATSAGGGTGVGVLCDATLGWGGEGFGSYRVASPECVEVEGWGEGFTSLGAAVEAIHYIYES